MNSNLMILLPILGAVFLLTVMLSKKRANQEIGHIEKLQAFAKQARFTFSEESRELEKLLSVFRLLQIENAEVKISNVLSSRSGELTIYLFEFSYDISGQNKGVQKQTAVLFDDFRFSFDHFILRPRIAGDFFASLTSISDVVLNGNAEFKKKFRILSDSPIKTHRLFTEKMTGYFLENKKTYAEGIESYFLMYEPQKIIAISKLQKFLEQKLDVYQYLKEATL